MTDRCEPSPELRGVDGWHWLQYNTDAPHIAQWIWDRVDRRGYWGSWCGNLTTYLAPVTPPAEVAALRAEVMRASAECADAMAHVVALRADVARLTAERDAETP